MTEGADDEFMAMLRGERLRLEIRLDLVQRTIREYQNPIPDNALPATPTAASATKPRAPDAVPRPEGIPSNFQMTYLVLKDAPAVGVTAYALVEAIRDKWWPGVIFNQVGPEFYRYLKEGRLVRDDDGRLTLTAKGIELGKDPYAGVRKPTAPVKEEVVAKPAPMPVRKVNLQPRLTPEQIEAAREKAAPMVKPAAAERVTLEHGEKTVVLNPDEGRLAQHLQKLMGSGFIDVDTLATVAAGRKTASPRIYVEDLVFGINRKIQHMKLSIVPYEKLGFYMRETA